MAETDGPLPQSLQFQRAEPLPSSATGASCVACKQPTGATYFHAQGQVVCPLCAQRIQSGQQKPPALSFARAALYGAAAALGGCVLYAGVAIVTGLEIGLVAIVVGYMVGKAIRHASHGLGGRPQQILAVALTYFSITTSYIPVFIYQSVKHPESVAQNQASSDPNVARDPQGNPSDQAPKSVGAAVVVLLLLAAAAPFLSLSSGISGLISLFIIFIGLQRAWRLTGRTEILVMGPYETAPAQ